MGKGEVNNRKADANESTIYLTKTPSEASKMLEAALLQMDGILSGAENSSEWKDPIKDLTRNLVSVIQNSPSPLPPPDARTVEILVQWLQPTISLVLPLKCFKALVWDKDKIIFGISTLNLREKSRTLQKSE
ncbi:hypothetical protein TSAR_010685 [Trichomalopsis sarcophagae]|uniref:Uncharacterized protein n=1 Tax=Trichomalopsis sarcophagae TaxID=543379 RepID=A0A232EZU5_9HYME|nr:hypothetical protein TSAR_010685 [Trichomalopsis sarcophagae]